MDSAQIYWAKQFSLSEVAAPAGLSVGQDCLDGYF